MNRQFLALAALVSLVAGCGGGARQSAVRSESAADIPGHSLIQDDPDLNETPDVDDGPDEDEATSRAQDTWPTGPLRIVQSIYFDKLDRSLAKSVGSALAKASRSVTPGIAFSPADKYTSGDRWDNVISGLKKLPSKRRVLIVHFGHHDTETYSLKRWAGEFYAGVFKSQTTKTYFAVSPGNEFPLSNSRFDTTMRVFTDELKRQWSNDRTKKGKAFPAVHLRLLQYGLKGSRTLDEFTVDGEYHLAASGEPLGNPAAGLPTGYALPGNDGQTLSGFAAYNAGTGGALSTIPAGSYWGYCQGRSASLWLPPLHRWAYNAAKSRYEPDTRQDPSGNQKTALLKAIQSFARTN